jgi:hypothetical protein
MQSVRSCKEKSVRDNPWLMLEAIAEEPARVIRPHR